MESSLDVPKFSHDTTSGETNSEVSTSSESTKYTTVQPTNSKTNRCTRNEQNQNSESSCGEIKNLTLNQNEQTLISIAEVDQIAKRTKLFPVTCQFCLKVINIHTCLPRHLRDIHKMTNEVHLKIVAKLHYFERRHGRSTRELFLCTKDDCLLLYTRKAIHWSVVENDATHSVIKVRKVRDLPESICPQNFIGQIAETVFPLNKHKFDFNLAVDNWRKEKQSMFLNGKRKFCPEKMPAQLTKIKLLINESNGFETVSCVPELFEKFEKLMSVRMGSTKAQVCRELRDFFKFCKLALYPPNMHWIWTCDNMDAALDRYQSTAQTVIPVETQFNQEFKQHSIVNSDQVKECFYKIMTVLIDCFEFLEDADISSKNSRDIVRKYRLLQFSLIFVIVNRNVCRVSTAMYLEKSFFDRVHLNRKHKTVTFACFDRALLDKISTTRNSGLRKAKHELMEQMRNTNKNFRKESVRRVILTCEEFDYLLRFVDLKQKLGLGDQNHLFLDMNQVDENVRKNVYSKWYVPLEKIIGMKIKLNTNVWRHSMCTIFAQYVSDLRTQKALDRHIGHTRRIAENFYELQPKEIDANVTSHAIDQLLNLPSNYKGKLCEINNGSQVLQLVSLEEETSEFAGEVTNNAEDAEGCDISSGESDKDDEDDDDDYGKDHDNQGSLKKRPKYLPFTHKVSTKGKEMPSIDLISTFLCNRPRKKQLTNQQYLVIAKYFYAQLLGKSVPNKTNLFHLVEEVDVINVTSYNHVCFLIKELEKWKRGGFCSYGF